MEESDIPKSVYAPIKLGYGHINVANERGWHAGCMAVTFKRKDLAAQMNTYFESKAHAALVTAIVPMEDEVLVLFTKRLVGDDKAELDEFNKEYAAFKEAKKMKQLEAEEKARVETQKQIDAANKERELLQKRLKVLGEAGVRHLKNCKKSDKEMAQAVLDLEALKNLAEPPAQFKDTTESGKVVHLAP